MFRHEPPGDRQASMPARRLIHTAHPMETGHGKHHERSRARFDTVRRDKVNTLGGVDVCLTTPAYDPKTNGSGGSGLNLPAGWSHISGKQALAEAEGDAHGPGR